MEAVDDEELARQLQRQLSGRRNSSGPGSDSDGDSLPDGFVLEEDSDDERQREMMGGAAGTSLAEAEDRARKRAREDAPGMSARKLSTTPAARHKARPMACARCGEQCRQVGLLSPERLAVVADCGLDDELVAHFGAFRAAWQRLALAGLMHDRLYQPRADKLKLAFDIIIEIGLTIGCEHTQRVAQNRLARGSPLAAIAPSPEPIYDDIFLIAVCSGRESTADLLVRQLPQLHPSAVCHPRNLRPTQIQLWPAGASAVMLDALVSGALISGFREQGARLFIRLAQSVPIADGWEAQLWLRNLYRWVDPYYLKSQLTYSVETQLALQELYRTVAQRFGTGGFRAEPPLALPKLTGPPQAVTVGTVLPLKPLVSAPVAEASGSPSILHHHTLAPEVIRAWMGHEMCKGKLCPCKPTLPNPTSRQPAAN